MAIFYNIRKLILIMGSLAILFATWVSFVSANQISRPIKTLANAATKISEGNLTESVEIIRRDEIGMLGKTFNGMAQRLRALIGQVQENTTAVTEISDSINQTTKIMSQEADQQEIAVTETATSIHQVTESITEVNTSIESVSISANETSSSITEMDVSLAEIVSNIKELSKAIDVTSSSTSHMNSSIKQISLSLETLGQSTENTYATLHELNTSVREVEGNAQKSHELSENNNRDAQKGLEVVHETISSIEQIQTSFHELGNIVSRLSKKSESIGEIVNVIANLAQQIDILSLNASIIASQAGEQGRGFAVVAAEVKNLAEKTTTSTRKIEVLIKDVQDETHNAVNAMTNGSERIEKGVALSNEAGKVLKVIIGSSTMSTDMAKMIANATCEQGLGINSADQTMLQIQEMVQQISRAIIEEEQASNKISEAVVHMLGLGSRIEHSAEEQSKGSHHIATASQKMTEMIRQILESTHQQSQGSARISNALDTFKASIEKNNHTTKELNKVVETLTSRSNKLEREIRRFNI